MNHITIEELRSMTGEGLIVQGCGGDLDEWVSGINELLTDEGILLNGARLTDVSVFEREGLTNILFDIDGLSSEDLDAGKLAIWRIRSHETFGGTWLSDYQTNQLGVDRDEPEAEVSSAAASEQRPDAHQDGLSSDGPDNSDGEGGHGTYPIQVYIENARDGSTGDFTIPLPTTAEKLRPWLEAIEAGEDGSDIAIKDVRSPVPGLADVLREIIPIDSAGKMRSELIYLASKLVDLDDDNLETFSAALDTGRHCENVTELINLTENLEVLCLQPAFSEEQYGSFLLEAIKDDTSDAFERLVWSVDEYSRELSLHILTLEKLVDATAYGRAVAQREGGVFTDAGYLTESGKFKDVYRGLKDVPQEYQLFPLSGQLLRAADVNLTAFLLKLHALAGDYMRDAGDSLETLAALKSRECLLLMDGKSAYLIEAQYAYQQDTDAFNRWTDTALSPAARAFAICVNDARGTVQGDIEQIRLADRQADILGHSIGPTWIEAEIEGGDMQMYMPEEWDDMSFPEGCPTSYQPQFSIKACSEIRRHLEGLREKQAGSACAVSEDDLLASLNSAYMAQAVCPAEGFLRIPREAAQEMLARGDADVYRLLPAGPEKLPVIDAVKSGLRSSEHSEFAIRRDDLPKMQAWAERKANDLLRQRERDVHTRSHGEEI